MKQIKKSIPKKVSYIKQFTHDDKLWNRYGIKMENGDIGYFHTTQENQSYFITGQEIEYQFESEQYKDKNGNKILGKFKKLNKNKSSHRYYINSLEGEEYIKVLRQEIKERIKQTHANNIISIPSYAASYTKDILANKGDFHADEILKDNDSISSTYSKVYDIIVKKMYNEINKINELLEKMFEQMDKNDIKNE